MEKLTREEMIKMAKATRGKVDSAPVSQEEMEQYPVHIRLVNIPTREGDAKVYLSEPLSSCSDILLINLHGGGFIRERTESDELFCRKLTVLLHCRVADVDYRIAPDHPYPAAVHETYDVVRYYCTNAREMGISPEKIFLLGHSAGGNLAITCVMQALAENVHLHLAGLISEYPPLDIYTDPEDKPKRGKGIPSERARLYNLFYCDRERQKESLCSPAYARDAELIGFPPVLIMTAGLDDLCTEAEDFALRLARLGNEVTVKRVPGTGHAFTIYRKEKHQEGFGTIVRFIRAHLPVEG